MLWTLIAVAVAGLLAGTRYRGNAIVVLSFFAFTISTVAALIQGWTFLSALGGAFMVTVVLQMSFLMGTALAYGNDQQRKRYVSVERDAGVSEPTS